MLGTILRAQVRRVSWTCLWLPSSIIHCTRAPHESHLTYGVGRRIGAGYAWDLSLYKVQDAAKERVVPDYLIYAERGLQAHIYRSGLMPREQPDVQLGPWDSTMAACAITLQSLL